MTTNPELTRILDNLEQDPIDRLIPPAILVQLIAAARRGLPASPQEAREDGCKCRGLPLEWDWDPRDCPLHNGDAPTPDPAQSDCDRAMERLTEFFSGPGVNFRGDELGVIRTTLRTQRQEIEALREERDFYQDEASIQMKAQCQANADLERLRGALEEADAHFDAMLSAGWHDALDKIDIKRLRKLTKDHLCIARAHVRGALRERT